jgi:hypothetical protein
LQEPPLKDEENGLLFEKLETLKQQLSNPSAQATA